MATEWRSRKVVVNVCTLFVLFYNFHFCFLFKTFLFFVAFFFNELSSLFYFRFFLFFFCCCLIINPFFFYPIVIVTNGYFISAFNIVCNFSKLALARRLVCAMHEDVEQSNCNWMQWILLLCTKVRDNNKCFMLLIQKKINNNGFHTFYYLFACAFVGKL